MSGLKIIKTLPHLIPLFLPKTEVSVYSNVYSIDTVKFLQDLRVLQVKDIKFGELVKLLIRTHNEGAIGQSRLHNNSSRDEGETSMSRLHDGNKLSHFRRVDTVHEKLEFSIKGDIISVWFVGYDHPIRFEFFGEDLEKAYTYDELYNRKLYDVSSVIFSDKVPEDLTELEAIKTQIPNSKFQNDLNRIVFVNSLQGVDPRVGMIDQTDFTLPPLFYSRIDLFEKEVERLKELGYEVIVKSKDDSRFKIYDSGIEKVSISNFQFSNPKYRELIRENIHSSDLAAGFISEGLRLAVFTDREISGSIFLTRPEKAKKYPTNIKKLLRQLEGTIEIGDYVVHEEYGIAKYSGLTQEEIDGQMMEYLQLSYAQNDQLLVPISQLERITKYIGSEGVEPRITRLGGVSWTNVKNKIKKSTSLLAKDLLEHYAKRELAEADVVVKDDSKDYKHFVEDFKFIETEDQLRATNEIIEDLNRNRPMNRLLIGDVGFGKTEVIMRAAFKIVENGGQVAILSPTTVLTAQHFEVFTERFKNFPITIGYLSRFKSVRENKQTIDQLNEGKVDIVIGTHRLLSTDVKFKKLQLIVVDEEQRFGVAQKEKIKKLNYGVHVLSVSATPIPRTLSMALSSIQDISIISTAPVNRKSVKTEIIKDNWNKVAESISYEVQRGGQIYFLHNEVASIQAIKLKLENLLPGVKFAIAHGQMNPDALDKVMAEFYMKKYDCLIASTIIENGLDVPNVNTIIINKAQRFGLSQLYQLRGRVGRSNTQSYCYLLYEGRKLINNEELVINNKDQKSKVKDQRKYLDRLQTLVDNQDLGAGFRIASRDLEIRGAGNLLGDQQSGHISNVGYALYIEILAQEVERLREILNYKEISNSQESN